MNGGMNLENNLHYFIRKSLPGARLSRDCQREYPRDVFPFGVEGIELFAYGQDPNWSVTEKKTGCRIGNGETLELARADAQRVLDAYGHDNFVELIKRILKNLNEGLEYDYSQKKWIDPDVRLVVQEVGEGADD